MSSISSSLTDPDYSASNQFVLVQPTEQRMTCHQAVDELVAIKERVLSCEAVMALSSFLLTYLQNNPDACLQEVERTLRNREIKYLRRVDELQQKADEANKQLVGYTNELKGFRASKPQETIENFDNFNRLSYFINALQGKISDIVRVAQQEERYNIYLFASDAVQQKGVVNLHPRTNQTCRYQLYVSTYQREKSNQERLLHAPNVQVNFDRLRDTGFPKLIGDERQIARTMMETPGVFRLDPMLMKLVLDDFKALPETIFWKVNNMKAYVELAESVEDIAWFYQDLKETIHWFKCIIQKEINIDAKVITDAKKAAKEGIEELEKILQGLPEKMKQNEEAHIQELEIKIEAALKIYKEQPDGPDLSAVSHVVKLCDNCEGISEIQINLSKLTLEELALLIETSKELNPKRKRADSVKTGQTSQKESPKVTLFVRELEARLYALLYKKKDLAEFTEHHDRTEQLIKMWIECEVFEGIKLEFNKLDQSEYTLLLQLRHSLETKLAQYPEWAARVQAHEDKKAQSSVQIEVIDEEDEKEELDEPEEKKTGAPPSDGKKDGVQLNVNGLPNIGNSCYINAGLQLLFDQFPESEIKPLAFQNAEGSFKEEQQSFTARKHLLNSIKALTAGQFKKRMNLLRWTLFNSGISAEFNPAQIYAQQDSAAFLECALRAYDRGKFVTTTRVFTVDGVEVPHTQRPEYLPLFHIPVRPGIKFEQILREQYHEVENMDHTWRPSIEGVQIEPPVYRESWIIQQENSSSLYIHVKRFDNEGMKNRESIEFNDYKNIDLSYLFPESQRENRNYMVIAFQCHSGSRAVGHYIAYRLETDGRWYRFDDDKVTAISKQEANFHMQQAYVLVLDILVRRELPDWNANFS